MLRIKRVFIEYDTTAGWGWIVSSENVEGEGWTPAQAWREYKFQVKKLKNIKNVPEHIGS